MSRLLPTGQPVHENACCEGLGWGLCCFFAAHYGHASVELLPPHSSPLPSPCRAPQVLYSPRPWVSLLQGVDMGCGGFESRCHRSRASVLQCRTPALVWPPCKSFPATSYSTRPLLPQVDWLHRLPTTHLVAFYLKYLCDAFQ